MKYEGEKSKRKRKEKEKSDFKPQNMVHVNHAPDNWGKYNIQFPRPILQVNTIRDPYASSTSGGY